MRSKFLNAFFETILEMISDAPNLIGSLIIRESMERKMMRIGGLDPAVLYRGFKNLEHRKLVKKASGGHKITKRGSNWLRGLKFRKLTISNQGWDKKWRVVIFDIPEEMKRQRNIFRDKLKSLGFSMLQKSVFVYPFSCEEELGFIAGYLGISDYVNVVIAESIGFGEAGIKKYYDL